MKCSKDKMKIGVDWGQKEGVSCSCALYPIFLPEFTQTSASKVAGRDLNITIWVVDSQTREQMFSAWRRALGPEIPPWNAVCSAVMQQHWQSRGWALGYMVKWIVYYWAYWKETKKENWKFSFRKQMQMKQSTTALWGPVFSFFPIAKEEKLKLKIEIVEIPNGSLYYLNVETALFRNRKCTNVKKMHSPMLKT